MFGLGFGEIAIILLIGLLIFGGRLPQTMRSLGQSFVQFKKGLRDTEDEVAKPLDDKKPA